VWSLAYIWIRVHDADTVCRTTCCRLHWFLEHNSRWKKHCAFSFLESVPLEMTIWGLCILRTTWE
jgi:hypothetical protein